jgi:arylsulfatase A-like enzyme
MKTNYPLIAIILGLASAVCAAPAQRPNVLFVISDDLNCRIGCYGDPVAQTPHLDRLARLGVRFAQAYCQFPLCNPTRSSVLSGRYPTSTGVLDNDTWLTLAAGQQTLPEYFAAHGYAVEQFGKIHHGANRGFRPGDPRPEKTAKGVKLNWVTADERARQQADDPDYWGTHHSPYRNMRVEQPEIYAWANEFGPLPADDPGPDSATANNALRSLRKLAAGNKPFFLAVGFVKPHVPLKAPQKFFDLYDPAQMPLPADFANEPSGPQATPPDELRANIDLYTARRFSEAEAREAIRAYYACVTYLDEQLGRVLDELEQLGVAKNTIIVLWGDHGWHLSEKGMWAKGTTFEVAARGPLFIADPRFRTAGQTCRRVVQYLDMYPTLADLCGLPQPDWLEGTSLRPLLENPEAAWNRPAFTVQSRGWFIGRSIRTERWRYTEWDEGRRGAMLFDHEQDPHEMHNLIKDPAQQHVVAELQQQLRASRVGRSMNRK